MPTHIGLITRQISRGGEREVRSLDKGENQIKVYDNKNVVCLLVIFCHKQEMPPRSTNSGVAIINMTSEFVGLHLI